MAEYIEREAAVKAAQDGADEWDGGYNRNRDMYIEAAIDEVPAADVQPVVHGHWIVQRSNYNEKFECSVCQHISKDGGNYCGNCGAKMVKEDD